MALYESWMEPGGKGSEPVGSVSVKQSDIHSYNYLANRSIPTWSRRDIQYSTKNRESGATTKSQAE
jgi:hypothetical protein